MLRNFLILLSAFVSRTAHASEVPTYSCDGINFLYKLNHAGGPGIGAPSFVVRTPSSFCGDVDGQLILSLNAYVGAPSSTQYTYAGGCNSDVIAQGSIVSAYVDPNGMNNFSAELLCIPEVSLMNMTSEQGTEVALAIMALWAVVWVFRTIIRVINQDEKEI